MNTELFKLWLEFCDGILKARDRKLSVELMTTTEIKSS